jgi:hypothetical protein
MRHVIRRSGKGELKRRAGGAWEAGAALLWTIDAWTNQGEFRMAEEEPILVSPPTQDVAVHVRDYVRFTRLLKWGALICLVIGFFVLLILK